MVALNIFYCRCNNTPFSFREHPCQLYFENQFPETDLMVHSPERSTNRIYKKVMVAIDTQGRVLHNEERKKYRIVAR